MLLETEEGIWARADATVFKLLMDGQRTERRLMAAGRTVANAHRRVAALRRLRAAADARAHGGAERQVEQELKASWGKSMHVRVPRNLERSPAGGVQNRRAALTAGTTSRAIRAYNAPLVDSRGRIALYFRIRYVGLKSKSWRPGLAADHAIYILREQALEDGEIALAVMPLSNMGGDAAEIAACWNALEAVEEGYRANAKVQYRIVWNLPHDLSAAERREMVEGFCERTFGRRGLPWVAGIHKADARGDQRNYHAHICFSTRPCERMGDRQWSIAQEKVNGLTDEDGLKLMRALAAGHMNMACQEAGLSVRFTHQTYKERCIDAESQEHVGPAAMAAHERGEAVAVLDRNAARVEANELAAERDRTARVLAAAARLVKTEQGRVDAASTRSKVMHMAKRAQRVAGAARNLATIAPFTRPTPPSHLRAISARATAMRTSVRAASAHSARATTTGMAAVAISARMQPLVAAQHDREAARVALASAREGLAVHTRLVQRRGEQATAREEQGKAIILTAPVPPYMVVEGRAKVDLTALAAGDRALVLELTPDTRLSTMRERIRRDHEQRQEELRRERERAARETQERRARDADEARRASEQRRREEQHIRELAERDALRREEERAEQARRERARADEEQVARANEEARTRAEQEAEQALRDLAKAEEERRALELQAETTQLDAPAQPRMAIEPEQLARRRQLAWAADYRGHMIDGWRAAQRLYRPLDQPERNKALEQAAPASAVPSPRRRLRPGLDPHDQGR